MRIRSKLNKLFLLEGSVCNIGVCLAVLFGIGLRFAPLKTGFPLDYPLNGGGLYLQFIRTILNMNFTYPTTIPYYSDGGLPFAYPPLVFYILAVIATVLPISAYDLLLHTPFLFSAATVPVFYLLSRDIFDSNELVLISTLLYAVHPATYNDFLVTEGLIEAAGTFLFLLGAREALRLTRIPSRLNALRLGGILGITVLASPGGGYGLALLSVSCGVVTIGLTRTRKTVASFCLAAVIGIAISAFWWGIVALKHGFEPIANGILRSTRYTFDQFILDILHFRGDKLIISLTEPIFVSLFFIGTVIFLTGDRVWMSIAVGGGAVQISQELGYIVPIFAFLAVTAGIAGTADLAAERLSMQWEEAEFKLLAISEIPVQQILTWLLTIFLILTTVTSAAAIAMQSQQPDRVTERIEGEMTAMTWVASETPSDASFLMITGRDEWWARDWGPTQMQRTVVNVPYGREVIGPDAARQYRLENQRLRRHTTVADVESHSRQLGWKYDYVYISTADSEDQLLNSYRTTDCYVAEFSNKEAVIFHRQCWNT
ncbi:hypothetical protein [Haloplanus rubicundus]|uniref:hypothetical protein n=1 Tax=Haloplanus rubicundus TaxID=1547898 RepID=UPI001300AF45|nr:hypothetical protein [Haloplanus rubicundus]